MSDTQNSLPVEVDLCVSARWIIPVVPRDRVYENCVLVVKDRKIVEIATQDHAAAQYLAKENVELGEQVVMPGLVNAHGHAAMTLLRGYADDHHLMDWLEKHIWPAEQKWVDEKFVEDGTMLAMAEMIRSGTTCFTDMYFFPDVTANVARKAGMRAQVSFPILDFPSAWAKDAEQYLHKGLQLHDDYRSQTLVNIAFGPHAPYTVSDEPFSKIATYAEELQAPIHIHLHETAFEVDKAVEETGMRPIARLMELGVLGPSTQCVHMTALNDDDIKMLQNVGAHVVHCPESNMKLASGMCPTQKLIDAGINLCIGTDSAASNNDLDMFGEMQSAALLGKLSAGDAAAVDARAVLEMATINGARALGLEKNIGSLETGKQADFISIDLQDIALAPNFDLISQLIYTRVGHLVQNVWVDGKALMRDRNLLSLSESAIKSAAQQWQAKIMAADNAKD